MSNERPSIVAPLCLLIGALLGLAGSFVPSASLRGLAWGVDGTALIVGAALLAVHFIRRGQDFVAAGFLVFIAGEGLFPVQLCRLRPAARHLPQVQRCGPRHWQLSARPTSCPCPCARSGSSPHHFSRARRCKYLQAEALRRYPSLYPFSPTHFWYSPCSVGRGGAFALRGIPRVASTLGPQRKSSEMPSNPSVKPTRSGLRPPRAAYLKR